MTEIKHRLAQKEIRLTIRPPVVERFKKVSIKKWSQIVAPYSFPCNINKENVRVSLLRQNNTHTG